MNTPQDFQARVARVPWQLWVVIALLSVEGVGNLLVVVEHPAAVVWLALKVLFIVAFIYRWRLVFVLFVAVAAMHVLAYASVAPFVAFLNLLMLVLVVSQLRKFFPGDPRSRRYTDEVSGGV